MGLAVVARFSVLGEAQVARTVLESAGLLAVIFEEIVGGNFWHWSQLLQGYRLCVVEGDLEDARALLLEARTLGETQGPTDLVIPPRSPEWVVMGLVPWALTWPYAGFLVEATRRRPTPARYGCLAVMYGLASVMLMAILSTCSRSQVDYPGY